MKRERMEAAMADVGIDPEDVADVLILLQERFGADYTAYTAVLSLALAHVTLERCGSLEEALEHARGCPLAETVQMLADVRAEAGR